MTQGTEHTGTHADPLLPLARTRGTVDLSLPGESNGPATKPPGESLVNLPVPQCFDRLTKGPKTGQGWPALPLVGSINDGVPGAAAAI